MEKLIGNRKLLPLFALICAALWGCGFSVTKTGYELFAIETADIASKVLFAGARFILAGILTLAVYLAENKKIDLNSVGKNIGGISLLALFQTVIQYAFLYIALANLQGSVSSVLNQLGSCLLVLLMPLADRNVKFTWMKLIGCIVGFAGLVYINLDGLKFTLTLEGEGAIILSSCSAAVGYIISSKVSKKISPILATGCQQLLGGVVLTLIGFISGGELHPASLAAVPVLLYLAFSIASAYVIWAILLRHNPVNEVTIYKFAVPVFGVLVSGILLGENIFTARIMISLIAVAGGIILVNLRPGKRTQTTKS